MTKPETRTGSGVPAATEQSDSALRALRVLELLAGMEQPASLTAIAQVTRLTKTRTYRILRSLQDGGFVHHAGRSGYRVGSRAIALATLMSPRPALVQSARPVLMRLALTSGETATLHLRSGGHRVLVLGEESPGSALRRVVLFGERSPLTSGCGGTSILAHLPQAEAAEVIEEHVPAESRSHLAEQLAEIRAHGYAVSYSSNHPGLHGIATALLDPADDYPLGSLVIAGPEQRLPKPALLALAGPLQAASRELAPRLAAVIGPNSSVRLASLDVTIQDLLTR
ncbi:IclR family acetate operon transcriptional repressor [Streptomyces sp. SAI-135]|jgi:DNA-binding IclR family transcriptional regulator|uniref:IclR family transcriptional regulator n=1 Tax=unclassified Streptomyces TaxID=2593676 RepID=UPI002474211C|nr:MULTISPECIES: IclR family transcriptional regulator [unclassified Streptomyces]MDH6523373.1 IclR family acetate operon transcriptional repressor [Streptomyces sp. SAI-090]MDH6554995.1 IclR family acetate operon transcriptional repressor [Streptomyces sp. SAI-041]MDH6574262.1 IclR family acetate operon transcriptional repressor [Streptomyces sp. SAI-117]MDH6581006.1 IclR family acetate operon transcriptional repressor [Streptomyces sp. SAI-133]MDH6613014.1 IclR family acetate operon transcri